jgi:hypothetical protein
MFGVAHLHWLCTQPKGQTLPHAPQLFVSVAPLRHLPVQTMLGSWHWHEFPEHW